MFRFQSARRALLGLAGIVALGAGIAARADELPLFTLSGDPPPGFGHLVEPQDALVDVYFGGRFLISAMATYTPESIALTVC